MLVQRVLVSLAVLKAVACASPTESSNLPANNGEGASNAPIVNDDSKKKNETTNSMDASNATGENDGTKTTARKDEEASSTENDGAVADAEKKEGWSNTTIATVSVASLAALGIAGFAFMKLRKSGTDL